MKKILALVMTLMLALNLGAALAETAPETKLMTSPGGDYAFEVPADYFAINAEALMTIFRTPEMQQLLAQMLGLEDASQLAYYFEMMNASNMMMIYSGDMAANITVQVAPATLTMEQIASVKTLLDASTTAQYAALGVAEEHVYPMDMQEIGGRQWYGIEVDMMGMRLLTMLTVADGVQYTIAFTGMDHQVSLHVLESFTALNAAE